MTVSTFTTPTTWLCPDDVFFATVRCWGGGGGSGGGQTLVGAGAGGGGGGYSEKTIAVVPGDSYTVHPGAAGAAGAVHAAGGAGGDSYFDTSTTVMAKGGGGGAGNTGAAGAGGDAASGFGDICYSGGSGSAFVALAGSGGGGGGSAGSDGNGGSASVNVGGAAGRGTGGTAGATRTAVLNGNVGSSPGGGAASGTPNNASTGAVGGGGQVQLEYEAYTAVGSGEVHQFTDAPEIFHDGIALEQGFLNGAEVWAGLVLQTITLGPGRYHLPIPRRCRWVRFEANGAAGGQGAAQGGTTMGGLGGRGGTLRGRIEVIEDQDELYIEVGAAGGNGFDPDPTDKGGEPGGAASQQNIVLSEYKALGACGGGYTGIWLNDELGPIAIAGAGGGGGAHGAAGAANAGGVGGPGGGTTAGSGGDGGSTTPATDHGFGFGAGGGTQTAGGAGGTGSTQAYGSGTGYPGNFLGGGITFRLGTFGDGDTVIEPKGGGGGGGYFGGGGGGNGSVDLVSVGGGGGGGGGSSFADARVANVVSARGSNPDDDGSLVLTFLARFDYEAPIP